MKRVIIPKKRTYSNARFRKFLRSLEAELADRQLPIKHTDLFRFLQTGCFKDKQPLIEDFIDELLLYLDA